MRKVKIFTNEVNPPWEPTDLENFLGGSEEAIVMLAGELAKRQYDVTVFHSQRIRAEKIYNGVRYLPREVGQCDAGDIFITWKDSLPWKKNATGALNIHWTADIEQSWGFNQTTNQLNIDKLNAFVNISNYQRRKNIFVPFDKTYAFPLGVNTESLDSNKTDKIPGTVLYCSSPDRGLLNLLQNWNKIKRIYPKLTLKVAYGWNNFNFNNFALRRFKNQIDDLLKQDGIEYLGGLKRDEIEREYWKAEYWILPLNNPDSELFCLNAVKSQYCGCIPIVNKIGALTETVGDYIPYSEFVNGKTVVKKEVGVYSKALSWKEVVDKYWIPELLSNLQEPDDKLELFNHLILYSDVVAAKKLNDKYGLGKERFLHDNYKTLFQKYTETKEFQDSIATDSDQRQAFQFLGNLNRLMSFPRIRHLLDRVGKLKAGSVVLDYGCSVGEITVLLANQFPGLKFVGADISPVKLKIANDYIKKEKIENVSYFECNDAALLEPEKYDAVICAETLEHILEYRELLEGLEKSVKIGGEILLTTPVGVLEAFSFEKPELIREHIHHYEHADIIEIAGHKKDFKAVHIPTFPIQNVPVANYLWSWTKSEDSVIGEIDYERKFKTKFKGKYE